MENKVFKCELCGKTYTNIEDMAQCVLNDSKKKKEQDYTENLKKADNKVKKIYDELKNAVKEYNELSKERAYRSNLETYTRLNFKPDENISLFTKEVKGDTFNKNKVPNQNKTQKAQGAKESEKKCNCNCKKENKNESEFLTELFNSLYNLEKEPFFKNIKITDENDKINEEKITAFLKELLGE